MALTADTIFCIAAAIVCALIGSDFIRMAVMKWREHMKANSQ